MAVIFLIATAPQEQFLPSPLPVYALSTLVPALLQALAVFSAFHRRGRGVMAQSLKYGMTPREYALNHTNNKRRTLLPPTGQDLEFHSWFTFSSLSRAQPQGSRVGGKALQSIKTRGYTTASLKICVVFKTEDLSSSRDLLSPHVGPACFLLFPLHMSFGRES